MCVTKRKAGDKSQSVSAILRVQGLQVRAERRMKTRDCLEAHYKDHYTGGRERHTRALPTIRVT